MAPMKREPPEVEAYLESEGLSTLQLARKNDQDMKHANRAIKGPLPEEHTSDVMEEIEMARYMATGMHGWEDDA